MVFNLGAQREAEKTGERSAFVKSKRKGFRKVSKVDSKNGKLAYKIRL